MTVIVQDDHLTAGAWVACVQGKQFLKNFNFIESFVGPGFLLLLLFFIFMKAGDIFSKKFVILSAQWLELIHVTLHYTECKRLQF